VSWGAPWKVKEVVGARNLRMAHLEVRSTCGGGRPKFGEVDFTVLAGQGLCSSLERIHGLSGKLFKGSGKVRAYGNGWPWLLVFGGRGGSRGGRRSCWLARES
jgi:hypothetical protein